MNVTDTERSLMVECACFTQARRHHQVLGRIGSTVLPFQVTAPALAAFSVAGALAIFGWRWWSWILPTPFDVMIAIFAPIAIAIVAQTTKVEGRDPFRAALAFGRYGIRSRRGLIAGRPPRRARRGAWSTRSMRAHVVKPPITNAVGHLAWNSAGQVWAVYRVAPAGQMHQTIEHRRGVFDRLRAAFMRLPVESQLLSVGEVIDPDRAINATTTPAGPVTPLGAELDQHATRLLVSRTMVRRAHFVAFNLVEDMSPWAQFRSGLQQASRPFGIATDPSPSEVRRYTERAAAIASQVGGLRLEPATAGTIRWLSARLLARGINEPPFDESWEPAGGVARSLPHRFAQTSVVEGGSPDDDGRRRLGRYVRIDTDDGSAFHTCLVLSDMPQRWLFPGDGEVLADLEAAAELADDGDVIEADVTVRITRVENRVALKKTGRRRTTMVRQSGEYAGSATGEPQTLDAANAALAEYEASLLANRSEPELQCTVIVHLADSSLSRLERQASSLQAQFEPANYGLVRPIGDQLNLLTMMHPASPMTSPCPDYRQYLRSQDLASMMPWCGSTVGDRAGMLLGTNLDVGVAQPVIFEPSSGPDRNRNANIGGAGVMGAGKSVLAKRLIEHVTARGGQVVTIDRSAHAEYVTFATELGEHGISTQVIQLGADTGVCLDPLRLFTGAERMTITHGFLAQLSGIESGSLESILLSEAIERVAERGGSSADVIDELSLTGDTEASVLARKLGRYTRLGELSSAVFGDGKPLDTEAGFVVFAASGLDLVGRETLENEHLARRMLDSQIAAQALLYLVAAIARRSTLGDPNRFAAALLDEFWGVKASPYGAALVEEWLREGRKNRAAVWLFSQHANDFAEDSIRSFLATRFLLRQDTRSAAQAGLKFLELDDQTGLMERIASPNPDDGGLGAGMGLMRDMSGRVGLIKIHESLSEGLRSAADTNPSRPKMPRVSAA